MKNDVYNLVYTFKLCNLYVKCSFQGSIKICKETDSEFINKEL